MLRLHVAKHADDGEVLAALTPASRLALRNATLVAVGRARVTEVRESQRRLVVASDSERRRIERDLHDGAQQRLVGVVFHLKIVSAAADELILPTITAAEARVRGALAELRRLAHGSFPAALAEEGLAAALDELVRNSEVPAILDVRALADVDPNAAIAAYATVEAVLSSVAGAPFDTRVRIMLDASREVLTVRVQIPLSGWNGGAELLDAADRVGAASGELTTSSDPNRTVLQVVIPCGS